MVSYGRTLLAIAWTLRLLAQEPNPHATQGNGAKKNSASSTREFLGLGPAPDPAAAKRGEVLFEQNCSSCHGEKARGAQGPNLLRSVVVLHDENDDEIGPVIRNGRPQAGMPAFSQLSPDAIHAISQFLKLQVELAANRGSYGETYSVLKNEITGDAKRGEQFFAANCSTCHSPTSDLAHIATKYPQASVMQARFIWPQSKAPAQAVVTTQSGEAVTGSLLKRDDFDVALRDGNGEYHYWPASEVKVEVEDKLAGHRSLLPKYTDANLHDVTAYLETLK